MSKAVHVVLSEVFVAVMGAWIYYHHADQPLMSAFLAPVCVYQCIYFAIKDARR